MWLLGCLGPSAHPCTQSQPWDEGAHAKSQQSYSNFQHPTAGDFKPEVSDQVTLQQLNYF